MTRVEPPIRKPRPFGMYVYLAQLQGSAPWTLASSVWLVRKDRSHRKQLQPVGTTIFSDSTYSEANDMATPREVL